MSGPTYVRPVGESDDADNDETVDFRFDQPESPVLDRPDPTEPADFSGSPDRTFRLEYPDEYVEPMDHMSHSVEAFQDPHETVSLVNPDFGTGDPMYAVNCADSARCFERTWRGHAEEAAGMAYRIEDREPAPDGSIRSHNAAGLYVDGEPSERTERWAGSELEFIRNPDDLRLKLEESGPGSSAIVHSFAVSETGENVAHAYNVVNFGGRVEVVDAQSQAVMPFDSTSIYPGIGIPIENRAVVWDPDGRRTFVTPNR